MTPIARPPFQFRLRTLLIGVTISGICAGMLRTFWGADALILGGAAGTSVAGLACMVYGFGMIDVVRAAIWPMLLAFIGFILIFAGLFVGFFSLMDGG